jgi:hypothetical protein
VGKHIVKDLQCFVRYIWLDISNCTASCTEFGYNLLYMEFPEQWIFDNYSKKFCTSNISYFFIIITKVHCQQKNFF